MSKLINYKCRSQITDVCDNKPTGHLYGTYHSEQTWVVVVVGGNFITIQNSATGVYANPACEAEGAPVVVGPNPYQWQQKAVPGGWYQIATNDGKYVWFLTGCYECAPIVLKQASYTGEDAQWGYEPATAAK